MNMGRLRRFLSARSTAPKPMRGSVLAVQLLMEQVMAVLAVQVLAEILIKRAVLAVIHQILVVVV
jgi:hypothetical protein